ncbi:MAG: hypothetical protein JSS89_02475 [Bacteroidetes bacterium]|nr:hypothetical protein [Bacteroidota bacterium]
MRPDLQEAFIAKVTDERYTAFKSDLNAELGMEIQYRVCEMPIFVSGAFRRQLEDAAVEIIRQCTTPEYLAQTAPTLDAAHTVPNETARPLFSVVDFAVCDDGNGGYMPRLIELQGFPSLLGYQYLYASRMRDAYELDGMTPFFSSLTDERYCDILRTSIFGSHEPSACALVEWDPTHQKTRPDFVEMERLIGLQTVDIRHLTPRGREVWVDDGVRQPFRLRRIFNRAIIDELEDVGANLQFKWTDDLDVEWAGHPNWYFRISKYSMPYLSHQTVPSTRFLNAITSIPDDLDRFVLKPLYSFAGKGVIVSPTVADIDAIPHSQRHLWILQEKVTYAECIATPYGKNKVEIRVMLIWPDRNHLPLPVMSLARTGRGALMGARYNTDPWTGSTGCLFTD